MKLLLVMIGALIGSSTVFAEGGAVTTPSSDPAYLCRYSAPDSEGDNINIQLPVPTDAKDLVQVVVPKNSKGEKVNIVLSKLGSGANATLSILVEDLAAPSVRQIAAASTRFGSQLSLVFDNGSGAVHYLSQVWCD